MCVARAHTIIMINNNLVRNKFTYLTEEKSVVDCICVCVLFILIETLSEILRFCHNIDSSVFF